MSRFFSNKFYKLIPYIPGEQPKKTDYIKLNTNESPFLPSDSVKEAVAEESKRLMLYSDPECIDLREKLSKVLGVKPSEVVVTNGSDEILNFAFMAFCDENHPIVFPDITYGFYPVFANLHNIPYTEIPVKADFSIDINDYIGINKNIVIANPNAPTSLLLSISDIEKIVSSNPDNIVIIDEAYIDFGGESAIKLINRYKNLLVTGTFSKSRSLAGARLGFGVADKDLIADINTLRYSTNPYNVNRLTLKAGMAALQDNAYYMEKCKKIVDTREYTARQLENLGFEVLESFTNFLFVKSEKIDGETLYKELKRRKILVRHFSLERIKDYNRITIGTKEQMEVLIEKIKEIFKENNL